MAKPKVSVIIPVYKTEKYLKRCLDSVLGQSLKEIEIILVDDGSPDGAPALCNQAAEQDARIRVIHKENQGLGMARNSGIDMATGEYVGFVDSDDYIALNMYERLYESAKKQEADLAISGICFVGGNMFDEAGARIDKTYFSQETDFSGEEGIKTLLLGVVGALPHEPDDSRYGVSVCKNIFKRETLEQHNIRFLSEREILSEDALFMVDYIRIIHKAVGVPGAYYCYCRNEDSLSKSYNPGRFEKSMRFLQELENRLKIDIAKEEYELYLNRLTQGFGRVLCSQEIVYGRAMKLPFSEVKKRLKAICTREEMVQALAHYPWYKLPIKQAMFAFTLKYKLYTLQKWFVILRDR